MEDVELKKLVIKIVKEKTAIDFEYSDLDNDYIDIPFNEMLDIIKQVIVEYPIIIKESKQFNCTHTSLSRFQNGGAVCNQCGKYFESFPDMSFFPPTKL